MAKQSHLRLAKPLATAYFLGLLSSSGPRILRILFLYLVKRKLTRRAAWSQLNDIFNQALNVHQFPAFCATLVGGSTLLQFPFKALTFAALRSIKSSPKALDFWIASLCAKFTAALLSASISFRLLNSAPAELPPIHASGEYPVRMAEPGPFNEPPEETSGEVDHATLRAKSLCRSDLAGRTMDLTLFSVVRALDIVLSTTWEHTTLKPKSRLREAAHNVPTVLFCMSAATIMWSWIYSPSRLPQAYNTWISAAAEIDSRLVLALRHARYGSFLYGKDTGMAPLLGSMARDYGLPEDLGDPSKTVPIPCELVHMGRTKSCEVHALWRFWRGWAFAARMHFPLQAIILTMRVKMAYRPKNKLAGLTKEALLQAIGKATRHSAFLGAFVSSFYYSICLARTRLGPKLFSSKSVTPQMWDSGLCILAGCLSCGLSMLVEESKRRLEIMLFVLPRAAATWLPRRYLPEDRWKEHVAFALSAAIVITTAQDSPKRVRGVLGKGLQKVLDTN
ncbi:integral membrane protein [Dothidotthia symphoricarpi CBS 119687]|uniref:Integral membrane protein n=1 Tax=Dothidotthia symphoricarpi CBS 119687 TaxID=1392245 RepID=A0A6A6AK46_9PLEO|nr:uncharacterized protein P153DRAFT_384035 [Dothidotthia symphoricarpi CBS 119687]KAF2130811.1 integral membrane protein [Dothidotthia symphoricarpi CBS 119687]